MQLRPYQAAARQAVYEYLRTHDDNPCVVIPTAGGKTPLIAAICQDAVGAWNGRALVLAHVRELLVQTAGKLAAVCPELRYGVHCSGLGRRDTSDPILLATIQSAWKKARELGPFDLILIDEAHMIPPNDDSMYRSFVADMKAINPALRIVGFTATPYRLDSGPICSADGVLNRICYEIGVRQLIAQGYLCPLSTKSGAAKVDFSAIAVRAGEFAAEDAEQAMSGIVEQACSEIAALTRDRKSVLLFCCGVSHAAHVQRTLTTMHGLPCGLVCAETPLAERDAMISDFRERKLKYLANVNVLTIGFDAPGIDAIVLLRPTLSPGLYYQMVGRGFRLHPDKTDCLILDYGENALRHGPVDDVQAPPGKRTKGVECDECHAVVSSRREVCPKCGAPLRQIEHDADRHGANRKSRDPRHGSEADDTPILSSERIEEYVVRDIAYSVHVKRNSQPGDPKSLRVDYRIGFADYVSEWICFEHTGYARQKAAMWWRRRSDLPVPGTAEEAAALARAGALRFADRITVRYRPGESFPRIIQYALLDGPQRTRLEETAADDEEIPF